MSIFQLKTVEDMERYYYGIGPADIMKVDVPVLTTTTGIYQAIYGAKVWSQLNLEANFFALLPKQVWTHSGWRVLTARAAASGGGVAENATLPETIQPSWQQVSTKPKVIAHTFNVSEMIQFLGTVDDSLGDVMRQMREYMGLHHAEMSNVMLNTDANTLAGNNFESLDRVTGSYTEVHNLRDSGGTNTYDANDEDMYGIDRDAAASFADAQLSYHATAGSLRSFTLDIQDEIFRLIWKAGGAPKVIATGYDTVKALQRLLQAQQRFVEYRTVIPTYNGVRGVEGMQAGFVVATYNNVPLIPSKDCLQDQATASPPGLSREFLLDTDYLWMRVAKPTQYFEAGISTGNPFAINFIGDKGLYRTMAELICSRFNVQGKVRDLKE